MIPIILILYIFFFVFQSDCDGHMSSFHSFVDSKKRKANILMTSCWCGTDRKLSVPATAVFVCATAADRMYIVVAFLLHAGKISLSQKMKIQQMLCWRHSSDIRTFFCIKGAIRIHCFNNKNVRSSSFFFFISFQ